MGPPLPLVFPWVWEGTGGRPAGRGHVSAGRGIQQWRGTLFGGWRHLRSRNPPSWQGRRVLHTSGCARGHSQHASVNVSSSLRLHWARDAQAAATDRQTPALCTTHVLYSGPVGAQQRFWSSGYMADFLPQDVRLGTQFAAVHVHALPTPPGAGTGAGTGSSALRQLAGVGPQSRHGPRV